MGSDGSRTAPCRRAACLRLRVRRLPATLAFAALSAAAAATTRPCPAIASRRARPRRTGGYIAARHLPDGQFVGIQAQGGEPAAPDRAGVNGMHTAADVQPERGPV